jgi:mannose/cellobiose epimerase-like protein (N-acyl-D-glucosamine 2-epimerase family)
VVLVFAYTLGGATLKLVQKYLTLFLTVVVLLAGNASSKAASSSDVNTFNGNSTEKIISELPSGDVWLHHLRYDLLPFWTKPAALGEPLGNFPTYRNNEGLLYHGLSISAHDTDKDYVRMKSRQIYAYGVGYHLTGDEKLLSYAKDGIDYLRSNAFFKINDNQKGVYSYFSQSDKAWGPTPHEINSQDLSYALNGLAFYYYLTRDPEVLEDIVAIKDYIFARYYDANTHLLSWYPQDSKEPHAKELVATLDQINAYMLCITPILPAEYKEKHLQQEWKDDLKNMAFAIIKEYYSPENNLFWGTDDKRLGTHHVDYGHSIKTFWMINQIGQLTDTEELSAFTRKHAPALLERAYIPQTGSWASRPGDQSKEWWIYAELDQMAATLSLADPAKAKFLPNTYKFWLNNIVDKSDKEVWSWVAPDGNPGQYSYKQSEWKNGFHSFEHAMVSYITTQQLKKQAVTLYFAFKEKPDDMMIRPYVYTGVVRNIVPEGNGYAVTFNSIK